MEIRTTTSILPQFLIRLVVGSARPNRRNHSPFLSARPSQPDLVASAHTLKINSDTKTSVVLKLFGDGPPLAKSDFAVSFVELPMRK